MRLKAIREMIYATRRLQAGDEFEASHQDARLLIAIRKAKPMRPPAPLPPPPPEVAHKIELATARAEYERVSGKKPFYGWDVETLRARIAAA